MIRARFKANDDDYRPVNWPVEHPFWCTGYGDGHSVIVAYAENEKEILKNWPEAKNIYSEEVDEYQFSSRFPKPDWLKMKEAYYHSSLKFQWKVPFSELDEGQLETLKKIANK